MDKKHPGYAGAAREYEDAILGIYRKCDEVVAEIARDLDEDTSIIIMSDHGNGINQRGVQCLAPWLNRIGLMSDFKSKPPSLVRSPLLWSKSLIKKILKRQYLWLNMHLSAKAKGMLNVFFASLRDRIESSWRLSAVDWQKTMCFFHYMPRVNLKGREPFGTVSAGKEYEEVVNLVIEKLYEARDAATGMAIVDKIFRRDEVFRGKHIDQAPDIIIWWKEDIVISGIVSTDINGKEVVVTEKDYVDIRTGNHTPYGVFFASGSTFKKGVEAKGMEIIDLAPTILYLLGEPVPMEMDGKVLRQVFTDEFLKANAIRYTTEGSESKPPKAGQSYNDSDDVVVEENLRSLGYIE